MRAQECFSMIRECIYWIESVVNPVVRMNQDDFYADLSYKIEKKLPCLVGKIGDGEAYAMRVVKYGYESKRKDAFFLLQSNAGFYPLERENEDRFVDFMCDAIANADFLTDWNRKKQYHFIKQYGGSQLRLVHWIGFDFSYNSWIQALEGKMS